MLTYLKQRKTCRPGATDVGSILIEWAEYKLSMQVSMEFSYVGKEEGGKIRGKQGEQIDT